MRWPRTPPHHGFVASSFVVDGMWILGWGWRTATSLSRSRQHLFVRDRVVVPETRRRPVDGDDDVLRGCVGRFLSSAARRHARMTTVCLNGGDDQQYEHQRPSSGVVLMVRDRDRPLASGCDRHAHDSVSSRGVAGRRGRSATMWTPPPKCRMSSIVTRLRRDQPIVAEHCGHGHPPDPSAS